MANQAHQEVIIENIAFVMKLKPGNEAEYEKRHDEIWPELSQTLKQAGGGGPQPCLSPGMNLMIRSVVVTEDGVENLSANLPAEMDEISKSGVIR